MTAAATDWLVADELAPVPSALLAPLYDAAARHVLVMPFCSACGQVLELEQLLCDVCGASLRWREVEPVGIVHSVTTVHRREASLILTDAPYHVIDVELASGHRVIMTTEEPLASSPSIGDSVRVTFRTVGGMAVPAVATGPTSHQNEEGPR